ncbi:MAG TPA: autotransporter-associated beta strand repeat-containing protein, partial [Verrucomicrobiae bacterium]|nr:autotransporter-associated beta strand repeat-containing protein [Verrucomicrobiae bacterium]
MDFIDNGGTLNLNDFSVNNIFPSATGVAQCPIYGIRMYPTNRNFTTLISPGAALYTGAGSGNFYAGGDTITASRGYPNIQETITIEGTGALLAVTGTLNVGQGLNYAQTSPASTNYVTLNLSGLDNFAMAPSITGGTKIQGITVGNTANGTAGSRFLLCGQIQHYSQGAIYLAKTNIIVLGNDMEIGAMGVYSNSMPCPVYLGITNSILVGNNGAANGNVTVGSRGNTNAFMTFNPAFLGGGSPPVAYIGSPASINGGRVTTFYVCRSDGGVIPARGYADFTGGNVTIMASTMQVGYAGTNGINASGTLTFDNGIVNVNNLTNGNQTVSAGTSPGGVGIGVINVNSNSTYGANATLQVNNTLALGAVNGTLTPGTAGTINVNRGVLNANTIVSGPGAGTINVTQGTLTVTGTAGTPAAPISGVALTNSTLNLVASLTTTNLVATSLTTSGANTINITSVPPLSSVPTVIKLIAYSGSIGGAGYNFTLGTLPPLCVGSLSNDTVNSSIDLVLTSGPLGLIWDGFVSGNWDTTTTNWYTPSGPNYYADGNYVTYPDGATTGAVNVTAAFAPNGIIVTNASLPYTFSGGGAIGGTGSLIKQGTGTLIIDNSGNNTFSGGTTISNGSTVQIGNADTSGNLPGAVVNNGSLIFDRTDGITVANSISGAGSLTYEGGNTLLLSGSSSFSGNLAVNNNSTLQIGSSTAVGSAAGGLTVSSGSTLDANGNAVIKSITVSGTGVGGNGAITDTGGSLYDSGVGLATNITLAGDTTFSYPVRWDLGQNGSGSVLGTTGHGYNLTLTSSANAYYEWKNLTVDAALANITVASGTLGVVGSTTLGNPASTLTLAPGAGLTLYNATANVNINKQVDFQAGATIKNGGGANVMNGPMTLEPGYCTFNVGGTS